MTKYERYQDYVIRDGRFVGEFEDMYRDFEDPWRETTNERFASEKAAGLNLICRLKAYHGIRKVLELGCGFGEYSARIADVGLQVLGIDISPTAISTARKRHQGVEFRVAKIDDFEVFRQYQPDVVVMAEVTWYVLDHLRVFADFLRSELSSVYLLHLLHTYPPGVQKYGNGFFTDLAGMKKYFAMMYLESGEVTVPGGTRTWFLGTWNAEAVIAWNAK